MPPVASLSFGARLVNKWNRWSPEAIAMSALRVISRARDNQVDFGFSVVAIIAIC